MDKVEQLYNLYLQNGLISDAISLDVFRSADLDQQKKLFELGKEEGLFEASTVEDFTSAWSLKKKDEVDMVSISEDGSLVQPTVPTQAPTEISVVEDTITGIKTPTIEFSDIELENPELKMEVLDLAQQLPTLNYNELNEEGQQYITELASKYGLTEDQILAQAKTKKAAINKSGITDFLYNAFKTGDAMLGEGILSIPSVLYETAALISDPINRALGRKETNLEAFEEAIGTRKAIDALVDEQEYRAKQAEIYKKERKIEGGIAENFFQEGNISDGFLLLGESIAQSAPVSVGIMAASASGVGLIPLATGATVAMTGPELRKQKEQFPEQSDFTNVMKAIGMAGSEMVFSTISQGTLGKVYKDIIFRQGADVGRRTFRNGLVSMYETALKKTGPLAAATGNGIEEVATQITQNLIDGRPAYEGVPDAFLAGMGSGGVYGAPIGLVGGIKSINEAVAKIKINKKLKPTDFNNIVQVFESAETTELQFDLAKTKRADQILVKELKRRVDKGEMSQEDADRIQQNFFDTTVYEAKLKPLNLTEAQKVQASNLLKEKQALTEIINQVDDASLSVAQQKRVDEIDQELATLVTITETIKTEEDAVQEPSPEEVDVRQQAIAGEEVGVGDTTGEITGEITPEAGVEVTKIQEEEVTELTEEQKDEVADLEYIIGAPKGKQPKFRLSEEQAAELDTEEIENTMNQFEEQELNYTTPELTKDQPPVNPVAESKSTVKIDETQADELVKPIEEFNGIPMLTGITDMLAAGVVEDSQGNPMEVEGGVLYNVLGKNKDFAWAGVTQEAAEKQYNNAVALYNNNKELFDRLWAEGKLPNGHVPMAIMRMADSAINSNEAVFRFVLPTLNTIPQANNQKALETFVDTIVKSKKNKSKVDQIVKAIKDNNIKGLNELFDFIVKDAGARAKGDLEGTFPLDTRSLIYDVIFSKPGVKTNNSQIVKDLFEGIESRNELFLSDTIYEALGEPSVKKANQGEVMSIVGIDVLNGGVASPEHGNYGFGPKGQAIALISNPAHGIDVFPEWKAKASRVFKKTQPKEKKPTFPKPERVGGETMGAFATDKAFIGPKVKVGQASDVDNLVGMLRLAFPQVSVATTQEEFDAILESPGVRTRETKGKTILGITMDGKIYLNPNYQSLATPIHEFGHVWIDYLRSDVSGKKGTELLNQGLKLVEGTDALKKAIDKYGDNQLAREEALVELMGTKGETIANAAKRSKFKEWLNGLFKYIKETFTRSKYIKREDIESLTLEDFINIGLADLFSGKLVNGKFDVKTAENAAKARFELLESIGGPELSMKEIIETGRAEGFSDAAIKAVLLGRGFKAADINPAMELALKKGEVLPAAFQNIEGGVQKGLQLYRDLQTKLKRYKNTADKKTKKKPTNAKVRAKALELLKTTDIFKNLPEITQQELILALDKSVGTTANRTIQREISKIKNAVRGYKKGARDLKLAQIQLKNFIRNAMPVSQGYSQADIANTIAIVTGIKSKKDFPAAAEKVLKKVEQERERIKKRTIKDIVSFVTKKAKVRKTRSNKSRSAGLDAQGQQFFKNAKEILKALASENPIEAIAKIEQMLVPELINEATQKELRGEKLTSKESNLLDLALAYDMFGDLNEKSLEDVQSLFEELKEARAESIARLNEIRQERAERADKLKTEANQQIEKDYEFLYETDSEGNKVQKTKGELEQDRAVLWNEFNKKKTWKGFKEVLKSYDFTKVPLITDYFRKRLAHLGSLTKILDSYTDGFFTKNIYDRLNIMSENSLRGYYTQQDVLDNLANSIEGVEDGYKQIGEMLNKGVQELTINGKKRIFSANELLRIYALSLNEVQRNKLIKQGFTESILLDIQKKLGTELTEFADKVVDYLSTDYFEGVNDVFSEVNDVNLGYVENYFPTKTRTGADTQTKLLQEGDFSAIFTAENSPALRERTDTAGEVIVDEGDTFTSTLNNHIQQMERFKAYAQGVKDINTIFNTNSVKNLLDVTGIGNLIRQSINFEVNPLYGLEGLSPTGMSRILRKYTSFALSFRLVQIPKQASSFINAYSEYQFRPGKNTPVLDFLGFMVDYAKVIANLPSEIKKAQEISATFRSRLEQGLEGDVYGLESGGLIKFLPKTSDRIGKARQAFRTGAAAPTVLGDALGVMGYMANYNRNIKNGMSKQEALEAFNNYNATQQSRRNTDKIPLQRSNNELTRAFTMFGSTLFLQINRTMISLSAIMTGKASTKNVRDFALNLGVANALFVLTANLGKLIQGDDEDREEVYWKMGEALIGLNLLYQIPLVGAGAEAATEYIKKEVFELPFARRTSYVDSIVNPYLSIFSKASRFYKEGGWDKAFIPLMELILGAQVDPVIGVYNLFKDFDFDENEMYDILGISKSYRPREKSAPKPRKSTID